MEKTESQAGALRRARGRLREWDDPTDQNTIRSLDRAMRIVAFVSEQRGLNLSTIAEDLGEAPATVYRMLVTLEGRGMVEFDERDQSWHIGPAACVIGASCLRQNTLVERARLSCAG